MSPDARLIAAAIRMGTGTSYKVAVADVANLEENLREKFPDSDRGIRGMVPVAYLKDILTGVIARLEAFPSIEMPDNRTAYAEALAYAKRRLADVEAL